MIFQNSPNFFRLLQNMTRNRIYIQLNTSQTQAIDSIASARFTSNAF